MNNHEDELEKWLTDPRSRVKPKPGVDPHDATVMLRGIYVGAVSNGYLAATALSLLEPTEAGWNDAQRWTRRDVCDVEARLEDIEEERERSNAVFALEQKHPQEFFKPREGLSDADMKMLIDYIHDGEQPISKFTLALLLSSVELTEEAKQIIGQYREDELCWIRSRVPPPLGLRVARAAED